MDDGHGSAPADSLPAEANAQAKASTLAEESDKKMVEGSELVPTNSEGGKEDDGRNGEFVGKYLKKKFGRKKYLGKAMHFDHEEKWYKVSGHTVTLTPTAYDLELLSETFAMRSP